MYLSDLDFIVSQEQHKDLLRGADRERLIRLADPQAASLWQLAQKIAHKLRFRMVNWVWTRPSTSLGTVECC
jgi:hypothetical protein